MSKTLQQPYRSVYHIDRFSSVVHNPEVTSGLLLACYFFIYKHTSDPAAYWNDILSQAVNLLFLYRFHCLGRLPVYAELVLLAIQNYACYLIVFTDTLVYSQGFSDAFMVCVWAQVALPYVFTLVNLFAYEGMAKFLVDTNNSFLAVLISHSFLYVNAGKSLDMVIFRILSYSLKLYLIYQYAMYQIVAVDNDEFTSYSDFYDESMYVRKRSWAREAILCVCVVGIAFDITAIYRA